MENRLDCRIPKKRDLYIVHPQPNSLLTGSDACEINTW